MVGMPDFVRLIDCVRNVLMGLLGRLFGGGTTSSGGSGRDSSDYESRLKLVELLESQDCTGDYAGSLPVASVDEFFTGNADVGSIGCNLIDHPGLEVFHSTLKKLEGRSDVQSVLVEVLEIEPDDSGGWPFSERVYILTSVEQDSVQSWFSDLQPTEVDRGWFETRPERVPELEPGMAVYSIWWD